MSQKRLRDDDDDGMARSDGHKQKKAVTGASVTVEAEDYKNEDLLPKLVKREVKKEVKRELKRLLPKYCVCKKRCRGKQMYKSVSRRLQLKFRNKLSLPIFTKTKLEGKDPSVLTIDLVDPMTGQVVDSGPESSMKVEIVTLQGHFEGNEDSNWTYKYFNSEIVRERKDKPPILTGVVFLTLNKGTIVASELKITDNSSWTRSGKFRLGVRVPGGYFDEMRVQEAITDPFPVKEHRLKSHKKKHPPPLDDVVSCLEKIAKGGRFYKRLSSENINTVKDFLIMLHTDTPRLRNILGPGMNDKMWEAVKNHAEECDPGDEMFVYYSKDEPRKGVVFNIVRAVEGLLLGAGLIPINDLQEIQKVHMEQMVKVAYENWGEVVPYSNGGAIRGGSLNVPVDSLPHGSPKLEIPTVSNSQHSGGHCFLQPDIAFHTSSSDDYNLLDFSVMELENNTSPLIYEDLLRQFDVGAALWPVQEPEADLVNASSSFLNVSVQSVAANDKAHQTWKTLITVLKFSNRIVGLKDLDA